MSEKLYENEESEMSTMKDTVSGTEQEEPAASNDDSLACSSGETNRGCSSGTDEISKDEGNDDTEKDTTGSEDSGGDKLYSDFLKENMEYDSKDDGDFVPGSQKDSDGSDGSSSGGTEVDRRKSEDEFPSDDEIDSDDERLITLSQLEKRSNVVQAKIRLLNQMKDLEIEALRDQITFLTTMSEKKLDTKYGIMTKMFRDFIDIENFLDIAIEIEKSKNEFQMYLHGTPPKKSRREIRYATKHIELAENINSLLQNVTEKLKKYFDVMQ